MPLGRLRVAIIGAGTAGTASAIFLARAGHEVHLYERAQQPAAVGAGILLQPSGMAVLQRLGLLEKILDHGARNDRLFGTNHRGRVVLDVHYRTLGKDKFGLGLHRGALFSILWNAALECGVTPHVGSEISGIEQSDAQARIFAGDSHLGDFDCVVIANGTHSHLRDNLGIPHSVQPYPWGALWALIPDDGVHRGELRQWYRNADQMLGIMPTGFAYGEPDQAVLSLFWSLPLTQATTWQERGLDALKRDILALAPVAPVLEHIHSLEQLTFASYADVQMPYWHTKRVVCIGDCAHATSPQLGQGANLALIDAWILTQQLTKADRVNEALGAYSRERSGHLRYYQQASRWLTPFFQSHSRIASMARDAALGPICRLPYVSTQMVTTLCGIKAGWLSGTLNID